MTSHRLDCLLQPATVALVGASERAGSPGRILAEMVINSGFRGQVFPVNPGYESIFGLPCYADLASLPVQVEQVIIALGSDRLETTLAAAIEHGAKAATIYSGVVLETDTTPDLRHRLNEMAKSAGMQICGANGMGFYNLSQDFYAGLFPKPDIIAKGGISYIAQSGTAFSTLAHNGCRLGFNLCVSSGNEMTTTAADYLDWSLEQADTRVVALFLETVRDPEKFVAALQKSNQKKIPVVILKIGKSPRSVEMALTHTGAIAGNHAAFGALLKRYGVIEVNDFDELAATLMLLQFGCEVTSGGFAAAFESGGLREFITDTADQIGLEFADIEASTSAELAKHLDPGLKPENPLDAWGSHHRFEERFQACFDALMADPNVAGGAFVSIFRDDYYLHEAIFRAVAAVKLKTQKPLALISTYADVANAKMSKRAFEVGIPLINGANEALLAFRHLFDYQAFKHKPAVRQTVELRNNESTESIRETINAFGRDDIAESDALKLLAGFSIPVVEHHIVSNQRELIEAAAALDYPLVLKTAEAGINHKSDCNGVFVGIENQSQLEKHYQDLKQRLGPTALVAKMIGAGVEIALGTVNDAQFGPIIMIAAGGIMVELMSDNAVAMCPLDQTEAEALLSSLKISKLLDGLRGQPAAHRQSLVQAIVQLSQFAYQLKDCISEIDINPLRVDSYCSIAIDALILRKSNH